MVAIDVDMIQIAEAVRLWSGWTLEAAPARNEDRLVDRFGPTKASELMVTIRRLEDEFYSSNARAVATDINAMARIASTDFKRKFPTIPDEIVEAFAWCYTFDYK